MTQSLNDSPSSLNDSSEVPQSDIKRGKSRRARKILVNQVKIARIQDSISIPTRISYEGKNFKIGHNAEKYSKNGSSVFENFKVELGRQRKETALRQAKIVSGRHKRSVIGMSKDFLEGLHKELSHYLEREGYPIPQKVLIAEPLSLEEEGKASGEWLSNYRSAVRTALQSSFEKIDFLPEPFAVFQYYRYGMRHPLISGEQRYIALVLDFGGGTFDVSVIETTADGDISHGGKNSKPLAANSIPVGGFYINRQIAEDLLFTTVQDSKLKSDSRKLLKKITSFQSLDDELDSRFSEKEQRFILNFQNLLREVEDAKVRICNSILDWSLSADLIRATSHLIHVPIDPFSDIPKFVEVQFRADRLKSIFENRIWRDRLRDAVKKAVSRANNELEGREISLILLSGGSSNIRWTSHLLERDLADDLGDAQILEISDNYQEIVAKGLAIECARQHYTPSGDGDFGAVTYNRLNLSLKPDEKHTEFGRFRPVVDGLPSSDDEGTLLPSATSLRAFIDRPMRWKVRLKAPPKHSLEYCFLKSSYDPSDTDNVHNLVDQQVLTPKGTTFGQFIELELNVREDGTATPSFIYGKGKEKETVVNGVPFFLDMTFAGESSTGSSYLGLDFGTATSAASFASNADISAYQSRSRDESWVDLNDLIDELPYNISNPLAMYVAQTDALRLEKYGLSAFESMLTFIAYVSFSDVRTSKNDKISNLVKPGFNRSAGPLWHLIKSLSSLNLDSSLIAKKLLRITEKSSFDVINHAVSEAPKSKHGKKSDIDYNRLLDILGNSIRKCMQQFKFGRFEYCSKNGFGMSSFVGTFRELTGHNRPFVDLYNYSGGDSFSDREVYLIDIEEKSAFSVSPFFIWGLSDGRNSSFSDELFMIDKISGSNDDIFFNPVIEGEEINVANCDDGDALCQFFKAYFSSEDVAPKFHGIDLQDRTGRR